MKKKKKTLKIVVLHHKENHYSSNLNIVIEFEYNDYKHNRNDQFE